MKQLARVATAIVMFLCASGVNADRIHMVDGTVHEGVILVESNASIVLDTMVKGKRTKLTLDPYDVEKIERTPVPAGFFGEDGPRTQDPETSPPNRPDPPRQTTKPTRQKRPAAPEQDPDVIAALHSRLLEYTAQFLRAEPEAADTLDTTIESIYALASPTADIDLFVDAATAQRARMLLTDEHAIKASVIRLLQEHPQLRRTLLLSIDVRHDDIQGAFDLLARLQDRFGDKALVEFANLTTAIAVVHDTRFSQRVNENTVVAAPADDIWQFYAENEHRMMFGMRDVPVSLLLHIVNNPAPIEEMQWALQRFPRRQHVGKCFFDITYDYDHLKGRPKRITTNGFSLPNIQTYGGVCADQAYYATTIGKSIGVPTAYVVAAGATVAHAWVGYLEQRGRIVQWNFSEGRYPEYQKLRGWVTDPQGGPNLNDSSIGVLAESVRAGQGAAERAIALAIAAEHIAQGPGFTALALPEGIDANVTPVREATTESALELLEAALGYSSAEPAAWATLQRLARRAEMTNDQLAHWGDAIDRLCGRAYPAFSLEMFAALIETVDDPAAQNELWERLFRAYRLKPELACEVRLRQGMMWATADEPQRALDAFLDVVDNFLYEGLAPVQALFHVEALLAHQGKSEHVARYYKAAFDRLPKPRQFGAAFRMQSSWYRIGGRYQALLREQGDMAGADRLAKLLQ